MSKTITIELLESRAAALGLQVGFCLISPARESVCHEFATREDGDLLLTGLELAAVGFLPTQDNLLAAACHPPLTPGQAAAPEEKELTEAQLVALDSVAATGQAEAEKARAAEAVSPFTVLPGLPKAILPQPRRAPSRRPALAAVLGNLPTLLPAKPAAADTTENAPA